ncbi:hypothetical protein ON010_g13774 [Phytophthora cinnamomi]|nr:hypothetical protein ON010_g13774 [Phytophthora cinnamomi]
MISIDIESAIGDGTTESPESYRRSSRPKNQNGFAAEENVYPTTRRSSAHAVAKGVTTFGPGNEDNN